jgi:hypothetical protein
VNFWARAKQRLSLELWRMRHRREKALPEIVWPPQSLRPRTVIVFLPQDFEHFDAARRILNEARAKVDALLFIVCLRENYRSWIEAIPDTRQVVYGDAQKNWLGLPRAGFVGQLRQYDPDLVIDLSPCYDPFLAHLAVQSGARMRLSLNYPDAGLFYNLLIAPEGEKPLSERYKILVNYL